MKLKFTMRGEEAGTKKAQKAYKKEWNTLEKMNENRHNRKDIVKETKPD